MSGRKGTGKSEEVSIVNESNLCGSFAEAWTLLSRAHPFSQNELYLEYKEMSSSPNSKTHENWMYTPSVSQFYFTDLDWSTHLSTKFTYLWERTC